LNIYGLSDIGRQRAENQDTFLYEQQDNGLCIFVVCDGMGGAQAGNIASVLAAQVFMEQVRTHAKPQMDEKYTMSVLENAVNYANYEVYRKSLSEKEFQGMGTTLIGGILMNNNGMLANIGDSRAYSIQGTEAKRLTRDHSLVEEMVDNGEITREEARIHPQRNLITRALGTDKQVTADCYSVSLQAGEALLLCTDGLSGMLEESELAGIVKEHEDTEICVRAMIDAANSRGGYDNITVLLVRA